MHHAVELIVCNLLCLFFSTVAFKFEKVAELLCALGYIILCSASELDLVKFVASSSKHRLIGLCALYIQHVL